MADTPNLPRKKITMRGTVLFAVACAAGCNKFSVISMPMPNFEQLMDELAGFGWFLSEGQSPDRPNEKIYSPLCADCAQRITDEQKAEKAAGKVPS
jgi:hypothetical protein